MNELLTAREMGEADRLAVEAGVSSLDLMERAGKAVADAVPDMVWGPDRRIAVLCGPGNNGGDGFVAARHLRDRGFDVRVFLLGDKAALKGDAAEMARRWPLPIRAASPDALQSMHLVIDALFGAGLSRPLDGAAAELVTAVNDSG
ncbi:MAG: NAD(P)H-hydrate epimerase, partial [Hyphomicrobium sp.]